MFVKEAREIRVWHGNGSVIHGVQDGCLYWWILVVEKYKKMNEEEKRKRTRC